MVGYIRFFFVCGCNQQQQEQQGLLNGTPPQLHPCAKKTMDDVDVRDPVPFEWYQHYETLKPYLNERVSFDSQLLQIGCGNSLLAEEMVKDGYQSITNIDISHVVIDSMKEKYRGSPRLIWKAMDCRKLEFPDESFDAVFDKGTMDALLCGDHSFTSVAKMMKEIYRVLKPGGVFLEISYGGPDLRVNHFTAVSGWKLELQTLKKTYGGVDEEDLHYVYIVIKKSTTEVPNK